MARKRKRLRTGSKASAPRIAPPAVDDTQSVVGQTPEVDDVEAAQSLTLAPPGPSDSGAAPTPDGEPADETLASPAESAPAVDSLPEEPDDATPTEEIHADDAAAAAPPSSGPSDNDRPVEEVPSEPLRHGSAAEPLPTNQPDDEPSPSPRIEDSVPTATLPVAQAHASIGPEDEPLPAEPVPGAYSAERALATQPRGESLADKHDSAEEPASTLAPTRLPAPDVFDDHGAIASGVSTDYTPEEAVGGSVRKPAEGVAAWRRLLRMGLPRATKANLLAGLLAVLLGLAIATQVQLTQERGLSQLSQTDLIRVLDDVSLRSSRLDAQIRELEATRDRLRSGTGSSAEALEQAQKRVDTLGILAGTVAATGPGVVITLNDPNQALTGPIILDLIQELRDAGAEAIDVGGVRVVASSFVAEADRDIAIDGIQLARPITIKAIGDAKTMSSAMTIPGGIVETVRQKKASAKVVEQETVEITSLHTAEDLKNARVVE